MRSCRRDQLRNPASGRCVLRKGRIGQRLLTSRKKAPAKKKTKQMTSVKKAAKKTTPTKRTPTRSRSTLTAANRTSSRKAVGTARPFGPIHAELFEEEGDAEAFPNGGIKYTVDLPDEWSIRTLPGPLRVVGRGMHATAVEAKLKSGEKVVVLVRPLGAQLPHKDDCKATRWSKDDYKKNNTKWMRDCALLRKTEYAKEISKILGLVDKFGNANLLPKLYHYGIVSGSTQDAPWKGFEAKEFGVQVWKQMTTTVADYIRATDMTMERFVSHMLPKIQQTCAELAQLGMEHDDLHLDNVAVDIDKKGKMSNVVFLDPASIKKDGSGKFQQCQSQKLVKEFLVIRKRLGGSSS